MSCTFTLQIADGHNDRTVAVTTKGFLDQTEVQGYSVQKVPAECKKFLSSATEGSVEGERSCYWQVV